jgi:hypothetical protein
MQVFVFPTASKRADLHFANLHDLTGFCKLMGSEGPIVRAVTWGSVTLEKPLTPRQHRRLSKEMRELIA